MKVTEKKSKKSHFYSEFCQLLLQLVGPSDIQLPGQRVRQDVQQGLAQGGREVEDCERPARESDSCHLQCAANWILQVCLPTQYDDINCLLCGPSLFRVNYDKKNWELIRQQLLKDHQAIHVINRAQILNDALNLAKSDNLDYETALGLTEYLSNEVEYIPWSAALTGLSYINKVMKRTPAYGDFKK